MAEVLLENYGNFTATYDGEQIDFRTNVVTTRILQGIDPVKSVDKEIWVNGPLNYTITLQNTSGDVLENLTFVDNMETTVELDENVGVFVNDEPAAYTYSAHTLTVIVGNLQDGAQVTITFQVLQA